jgi:hypothetical protein
MHIFYRIQWLVTLCCFCKPTFDLALGHSRRQINGYAYSNIHFQPVLFAGRNISLDFHTLCSPAFGYSVADGLGHTFKAQICGVDSNPCRPRDWESPVEYGRVVQFWGSVPYCNVSAPECIDQITGKPVCCTAPCQVTLFSSRRCIDGFGSATRGVQFAGLC